jgi:prophage antirepressor-like protein
MVIPFNFKNHDIRTIVVDSGEPVFVARDVAAALGYKDQISAIKQHCRGVAKHHPIRDSLGRTQDVRVIREPDVYRLVVNSKLPSAEKFEAWLFEEVLPTIRKTGRYSVNQRPEMDMVAAVEGVAAIAKHLNYSNSAKADAFCQLSEHYGIPKDVLKIEYAVDEGLETSGSSRVTKNITDLLSEHGATLTSRKANALLMDMGYLEEHTRRASNGKVKKFKAVSDKGAKYGKNITHRASQGETQPHWFVDSFADLLEELNDKRDGVSNVVNFRSGEKG